MLRMMFHLCVCLFVINSFLTRLLKKYCRYQHEIFAEDGFCIDHEAYCFWKVKVKSQGHQQSKCEKNWQNSKIHIWKSMCSIKLKFSPKLHGIRTSLMPQSLVAATSGSGGIRGHVSNDLDPISPKRFITEPSNKIWSIALALGYLDACKYINVSLPVFKVVGRQMTLKFFFAESRYICIWL